MSTISSYISTFPPQVQKVLLQICDTVRQAAPEATETIKYGMPTFVYHGNLVHFAAFKNHIGFYSIPGDNDAFREELSHYKQGKGSVQFPLSEPMPLDLIGRMVRYKVGEKG